jgi:hypothetical protein
MKCATDTYSAPAKPRQSPRELGKAPRILEETPEKRRRSAKRDLTPQSRNSHTSTQNHRPNSSPQTPNALSTRDLTCRVRNSVIQRAGTGVDDLHSSLPRGVS